MKPPSTLIRSGKRLGALHRYGVLDTPSDAAFDEITGLVSQLCEAPIALLSFVDEDRQFFKSRVGYDGEETPLEASVCAHAIEAGEAVLEINDTLADPRTSDNPLCTGPPFVRFYAGAPLQSPDGQFLGTLCVLDLKPRGLSEVQRRALRVLARQIMVELDLRVALRRQETLHHEMDHRVKNSLQSVASFVRLQSARHPEPAAKEALDAVGRRVSTVALLHQELTLETQAGLVGIDRYMEKLGALFSASAPAGVEVMTSFEPVFAETAVATAVAAIANEFVTNSFKHAFPQGRRGQVSLSGRVGADGAYVLRFADDGVGLAAGETTVSNGLGMRIMHAATGQIGGALMTEDCDIGCAIALDIPAAKVVPPSSQGPLAGQAPGGKAMPMASGTAVAPDDPMAALPPDGAPPAVPAGPASRSQAATREPRR